MIHYPSLAYVLKGHVTILPWIRCPSDHPFSVHLIDSRRVTGLFTSPQKLSKGCLYLFEYLKVVILIFTSINGDV